MNSYKKFNVINKNDYLIYLRQIIIVLNKHFYTLERYIIDLENVINELNLDVKSNQQVDSFVYEEFRDKTQFVQNSILNLIGDMQSDSLSYNKFKRTLVKRNTEVKQLIGKIPEELSRLLNEMNTMRNWGLHEPESLLNAHLENIKEFWPEDELYWYFNNFNPIHVHIFEKYEGKWIISLYESCKGSLEQFKTVYEYILKDYSLLSETDDIKINLNKIKLRPFDIEMKLPITSLEMQKKSI